VGFCEELANFGSATLLDKRERWQGNGGS